MALAPFLFMGIGILISYRYKITATRQKEIYGALSQSNVDLSSFSDVI
jgi:Na+/melibiose symporter-like transporter